ncbi:MAG: hypothetical protein AB8G18_14820 [Gammaproteobacteria bacterium]
MEFEDSKSSSEIIREMVLRLADVVDEEEPSHREICERMMTLCQAAQSTAGDDSIMRLILSLQYFDRMQQRTRYLVHLIEKMLIDQPLAGHEISDFHSQYKASPHQADAEWLSDLLLNRVTTRGENSVQ